MSLFSVSASPRRMDKEILVHIYNGKLLRFKKERILVSPNEVNETRAYCTG